MTLTTERQQFEEWFTKKYPRSHWGIKKTASGEYQGGLTAQLWEVWQESRGCMANRESQPVGFRYRHKDTVSWLYNDWRWPDSVEAEQCQIEWLYTAPPAVVNGRTVDGWMTEALLQKKIADDLRKAAPAVPEEMTGDGVLTMHDCGYIEGWNACRAAMLAGAPNGGN